MKTRKLRDSRLLYRDWLMLEKSFRSRFGAEPSDGREYRTRPRGLSVTWVLAQNGAWEGTPFLIFEFRLKVKGSIHTLSRGWNGAPGEIRTPDTLIRSQVLYPAELRARTRKAYAARIPPKARNLNGVPEKEVVN
jgi:hypothetical protein